MPRVADTILVGERGAPLMGDSLSVMVRKQLREMGVDRVLSNGNSGHYGTQDLGDGAALFQAARPARCRPVGNGQVGANWQTQERNGIIIWQTLLILQKVCTPPRNQA